MKNTIISFLILFILMGCSSNRYNNNNQNSGLSIMIQHQYKQVGFNSPQVCYGADSNYVLVKEKLKTFDKKNYEIEYFVMDLNSNLIVYKNRIKKGDIQWVNGKELQIFDNSDSNANSVGKKYILNLVSKKSWLLD